MAKKKINQAAMQQMVKDGTAKKMTAEQFQQQMAKMQQPGQSGAKVKGPLKYAEDLTARRRFLDQLAIIKDNELGLKFDRELLAQRRVELETGTITALTQQGKIMDKVELGRAIQVQENSIKNSERELGYHREDFYFMTKDVDLVEFQKKIDGFYHKFAIYCEEAKKKLKM